MGAGIREAGLPIQPDLVGNACESRRGYVSYLQDEVAAELKNEQ